MGIVVGHFQTISRQRGFPAVDGERLRLCLSGLGEHATQELAASLKAAEAGVETSAQSQRIEAVIQSCSERVRLRFGELGVAWDPRSVCRWTIAEPAWEAQLSAAHCRDDLPGYFEPAAEPDDADDHEMARGKPMEQPKHPPAALPTRETSRKSRVPTAIPPGIHVFGATAAIKFELDEVKRPHEKGRGHTVRLEGAKRRHGNASTLEDDISSGEVSEHEYDWNRKIILQLTLRELHQVAAVTIGAMKLVTVQRKGAGKDKSATVELQPAGLWVRMREGSEGLGVRVSAESLFHVAALFLRSLTLNQPELGADAVLSLLRLTSRTVQQPA